MEEQTLVLADCRLEADRARTVKSKRKADGQESNPVLIHDDIEIYEGPKRRTGADHARKSWAAADRERHAVGANE